MLLYLCFSVFHNFSHVLVHFDRFCSNVPQYSCLSSRSSASDFSLMPFCQTFLRAFFRLSAFLLPRFRLPTWPEISLKDMPIPQFARVLLFLCFFVFHNFVCTRPFDRTFVGNPILVLELYSCHHLCPMVLCLGSPLVPLIIRVPPAGAPVFLAILHTERLPVPALPSCTVLSCSSEVIVASLCFCGVMARWCCPLRNDARS